MIEKLPDFDSDEQASFPGPQHWSRVIGGKIDEIVDYLNNTKSGYIFKFSVGEDVTIKEIEQPARIVSIIIEGKNVLYKVEYFWNGELKVLCQDENQLEKIKKAG